jgi:hypothetical protein
VLNHCIDGVATVIPCLYADSCFSTSQSWTVIDCDLVATEVKGLHFPSRLLDSPIKIDEAVDSLTTQLANIANISTTQ